MATNIPWSLPSASPVGDCSDNSTTPTWLGYASSGVAVIFFGSNFAPVKKIDTGDGMFFQWVLCSAIWIVGLVVHAVRNFPKFYPLAMLGGFLWSSGNMMVVPIIQTIGLAQGILIWGSLNLLSGWASGRFGWFGLTPEVPSNLTLNYVGVALCITSAFIYLFIKSDAQPSGAERHGSFYSEGSDTDDHNPILSTIPPNPLLSTSQDLVGINDGRPGAVFYERWSPNSKRLFGIILSVISGIFYGMAFTPVIYMQNNFKTEDGGCISQNGLDFVFAHWCGVYCTSTAAFLLYCGVMRNRPRVYPGAILPGFLSGVMWAVADAAWFIANSALSEAVAFPIITAGPGVVASLWGVILFKEIKGARNLLVLLCASCLAVTGAVLTGLSKIL